MAHTETIKRTQGLCEKMMPQNPNTLEVEWKKSAGLVPYEQAVEWMERRVAQIIAGEALEVIWLLEHPPLYTAGTSSNEKDLIDPNRFPVFKTKRGGCSRSQITSEASPAIICSTRLSIHSTACS